MEELNEKVVAEGLRRSQSRKDSSAIENEFTVTHYVKYLIKETFGLEYLLTHKRTSKKGKPGKQIRIQMKDHEFKAVYGILMKKSNLICHLLILVFFFVFRDNQIRLEERA